MVENLLVRPEFDSFPVPLSALPDNAVDYPFVRVQWIHSELSACDRRNKSMILNREHILTPFLEPPMTFKNTQFA
jgi:hypothetical protein